MIEHREKNRGKTWELKPEIKTIALDALDIEVNVKGNDDVEIKGVIPLALALPKLKSRWYSSLSQTLVSSSQVL